MENHYNAYNNEYNEYNNSILPAITRLVFTYKPYSSNTTNNEYLINVKIYVTGREVPYNATWADNNKIEIYRDSINFYRRSGIYIYEIDGRPYLNLTPLFTDIRQDIDFPFAESVTFNDIVASFKKNFTVDNMRPNVLYINNKEPVSINLRPKYIKNVVRVAYNKAINNTHKFLPRNITKGVTTYLNFGGRKRHSTRRVKKLTKYRKGTMRSRK